MPQIYTYRQLEALYVQAGGSAKLAPVMAAIAKAESSGNPQARHVNSNGSIDQGLWQINSSNSGLYQGKNIFDPLENARVAVRLAEHSGNKLRNWTTYTSGAFRRYLVTGTTAKIKAKAEKSFGIYTDANYAGTDQGVDYKGKGAIPALGSGVITDIGTSSIIEGGRYPYVIYRLTSGPYKGHFVYVAENFVPTKIKVGTKVKLGQVIGMAPGVYPYTETGFNKTAKGWNPSAALSAANPHGATAAGNTMLAYIKGLEGQKGGTSFLSGAESTAGSAAKTAWGVFTNPIGTAEGAAGSAASAVASPIEKALEIGLKKVLDALAIAGGGVIFLMGFILIAADIGLSTKAGKIAAAVPAGRIIAGAAVAKKTSQGSTATNSGSGRAEERREEKHQASLQESAARTKKHQAQATESRTRQKNRRKTAKEQKASETKAYYAGARDAASPTMAKIRKNKKK